mmetsp:Transcript_1172/g.2869  ORF Transcript_1172/g.2869 Transcript_1172/m.2869 type:complete len:422 (-) Transcript_1172:345-1610(-)
MRDYRGVGPRVFGVHGRLAVGIHQEVQRLVAPPRRPEPVERELAGFGPCFRQAVVQTQHHHRALDLLQRQPVHSRRELLLADLGPLGPVERRQRRQPRLPRAGRLARCGLAHDRLEMRLEGEGREDDPVVGRHVQPPPRPLVQHRHVPGVAVDGDVGVAAGDARRAEHPLVLPHADRHRATDGHGLDALRVELRLALRVVVEEHGRACRLARRRDVVRVPQAVVVGVDQDRCPRPEVDVLLPPVRHVVCRHPRLEHQKPLQPLPFALDELRAVLLCLGIVCLAEERLDGAEVARERLLEGRHRLARHGALERVEERPPLPQEEPPETEAPDHGENRRLRFKHPPLVVEKAAHEDPLHRRDAEEGHAGGVGGEVEHPHGHRDDLCQPHRRRHPLVDAPDPRGPPACAQPVVARLLQHVPDER